MMGTTSLRAGAFIVITIGSMAMAGGTAELSAIPEVVYGNEAPSLYMADVPPAAPMTWSNRFLERDHRTCFVGPVPPRQPPPVALELCATQERIGDERADIAPPSAAWLRHTQSQTRERRPMRRHQRPWEMST